MTAQQDLPPQAVHEADRPSGTGSLGRTAARGASVVYAGQGLRIVLQVVSVSVLARLLSPSDYGLIAIVVAVVGVGEIFRDFGLSTAAIQAPALSRHQRATLFWLNTGIGAVLTLIVFFGAPVIAMIFGYDQLVGIARALSFTFLINGMMAQYRASLVRRLRFKATTFSDLTAQFVGIAAAFVAAILGAGYWALVLQQLVQAGIGLLILVLLSRWLPSKPAPIAEVRPMINYGWNLAGSQLIGYLNSNIDTLVISLRFNAASLGLYNRGFQLLMRPLNQMRGPTNNVAVPVLARVQDDVERSNSYVLRGQLVLGYTLVPILALAFAAATPAVALFLGPGWSSVAPIIAALAVAGAFETLAYVGSWVYQARGLTPQLLRYTLISLAIKVACVLIGSNFGIVGVAIGYAVAPGIGWPISLWWLARFTPYPRNKLWAGAGRILACAVPAAIVGRLVIDLWVPALPSLLQILIAAAGVGLVYLVGCLIGPIRRDVVSVLSLARKAVAGR